jgi:hypothetical protein
VGGQAGAGPPSTCRRPAAAGQAPRPAPFVAWGGGAAALQAGGRVSGAPAAVRAPGPRLPAPRAPKVRIKRRAPAPDAAFPPFPHLPDRAAPPVAPGRARAPQAAPGSRARRRSRLGSPPAACAARGGAAAAPPGGPARRRAGRRRGAPARAAHAGATMADAKEAAKASSKDAYDAAKGINSLKLDDDAPENEVRPPLRGGASRRRSGARTAAGNRWHDAQRRCHRCCRRARARHRPRRSPADPPAHAPPPSSASPRPTRCAPTSPTRSSACRTRATRR